MQETATDIGSRSEVGLLKTKATGADVEENMKSAGIPGHIVMILADCPPDHFMCGDLCFQKPEENAPGSA